jgi:hypothetical protein
MGPAAHQPTIAALAAETGRTAAGVPAQRAKMPAVLLLKQKGGNG